MSICMSKDEIRIMAASIENIDIESFLTQIQSWQQSLDKGRSYDDCVYGTIGGVMDIFYDCCVFI